MIRKQMNTSSGNTEKNGTWSRFSMQQVCVKGRCKIDEAYFSAHRIVKINLALLKPPYYFCSSSFQHTYQERQRVMAL